MSLIDDAISLVDYLHDEPLKICDNSKFPKKDVLHKPFRIAITTEHNVGSMIGDLQISQGVQRVWKTIHNEMVHTEDNQLIYLVEAPKQECDNKHVLVWYACRDKEKAALEAERIMEEYYMTEEVST